MWTLVLSLPVCKLSAFKYSLLTRMSHSDDVRGTTLVPLFWLVKTSKSCLPLVVCDLSIMHIRSESHGFFFSSRCLLFTWSLIVDV